MRRVPALGVLAVAAVALAGCSGGGGSAASPSSTTTSSGPTSASAPAQEKVYSEDELRELISGMRDGDGNELKLYSKEQVDQGGKIADLLLNTASVDPEDCKDIATAGLVDKVEHGDVAVALSDSDQPRSLSAQSGSEGPDAEKVLKDISGNMDKCAKFTVKAVGQTYEVSSEELDAKTKAKETFGTISTRSDESQKKLMQVSAADGRLLVVATKSGPSLGDPDQKELEDLINKVLAKAEGVSETPGEMMSSSSGSMTSSPSSMSSSPSSKSLTPTPTMSTSEGSVTSSSSPSTSP
ncbi:hypothetical protein [Arthrobacter sp. StoSoilA2]|uniref:hypothetical protein n=1 Tax=Arthrobacter sp. StoSoilA2 TaxID=2830990 RepID=UPI001CC471DB|nr:hypothetical protein [Arthrobacter sp. StoSoilA2]